MKSSTFSTEINGGYDTDQAPFQKTNTTNSGFSKMCKKINQSDNQEDQMLLDDQFEVEHQNNQYLTAANFCRLDTIQKTKLGNQKANPQIASKWSLEKNHGGNEAIDCLQKTIEKLKYQAEYFQGECQKYKKISEDQQKIIMSMRKQIKKDKIEYQIFQATVKAKLQSFMKTKELEIAGLNEQIASKSKQIQQLQACIKKRSNPPGMTIQIIQDGSNMHIQNLQKIITQQECLLAANYTKIQQSSQELFKITVQNINLKSELLNLQHVIRNMEFDKNKIEDQRNAEVKKNSKMMQMLSKGEKDIRAMGAHIMALLNGQPNAQLAQDIQRLIRSSI